MARRSKEKEPVFTFSGEEKHCPLCLRPLGGKVSLHHLVPKSLGGKHTDTVMLHQICHSKIHQVFSERELLKHYHTIAKLRMHEEIHKFVEWLENKPPEFYTRGRKKKR